VNILFVHQSFPGQYQYLAPALAARGHKVCALSFHPSRSIDDVETFCYRIERGNTPGVHSLALEFESKVIRAEAVALLAQKMRDQGYRPDVICGHSGWGETLFLKDVCPDAKLLAYCEFYYRPAGADFNFDPEFPEADFASARLGLKNAHLLLTAETMDAGISPTRWQQSRFPEWAQKKIAVVHDGVDTDHLVPNSAASVYGLQGALGLMPQDEIVTYVSRSLEPYRGFHVFMRALPAILQRRPNAHVLIVGGEERGYGQPAPGGRTWKQHMLDEVGASLDLKRVHFLGMVPFHVYQAILQISTVHVYLTYPFLLSWSLLEAMSTECLVVASATPPVQEVIAHGRNGLLVDFFDVHSLAETVSEALADRDKYRELRSAARATILDHYDLRRVCLPQQVRLVESLA
jgi:glycosyltransferase involved in cell wall biosynthesis